MARSIKTARGIAPTCKMLTDDAEKLFRKCTPKVWLVTSAHDGRAGGLVAAFVMKASLVKELPRVAIGIAKHHHTWQLIDRSRAFALHLLSDENVELAARFGLQTGHATDKFRGLEYETGQTGSPIINNVAGWLDCRVEAELDIGDRTVFVGEVLAAQASPKQALQTDRFMERLAPAEAKALADAVERDSAVDAAAIRAWRGRAAAQRAK